MKKRTTRRTTKPVPQTIGKRYSTSPAIYAIYDELAQQDADNGKHPRKNIAATMYEVGMAELQRRMTPGDREKEMEK